MQGFGQSVLAENNQIFVRGVTCFEAGTEFPENAVGPAVFRADQKYSKDWELGPPSLRKPLSPTGQFVQVVAIGVGACHKRPGLSGHAAVELNQYAVGVEGEESPDIALGVGKGFDAASDFHAFI